jgi:ferredoxin-thioredoxin reductase catalytic chain
MPLDKPTDEDRHQASAANMEKMWRFAEHYAVKSGTYLQPQREITEFLVIGLARHIDQVGRPLCPCNFYPDIFEEAKSSEWSCPCQEMQKYKYCHCMLFTNSDGLPITEHLPEEHEGREIYGVIRDPHPDKGRALGRLEEERGHPLSKR